MLSLLDAAWRMKMEKQNSRKWDLYQSTVMASSRLPELKTKMEIKLSYANLEILGEILSGKVIGATAPNAGRMN